MSSEVRSRSFSVVITCNERILVFKFQTVFGLRHYHISYCFYLIFRCPSSSCLSWPMSIAMSSSRPATREIWIKLTSRSFLGFRESFLFVNLSLQSECSWLYQTFVTDLTGIQSFVLTSWGRFIRWWHPSLKTSNFLRISREISMLMVYTLK